MSETALTIDEVEVIYHKLSRSFGNTKEDYAAWNQACDAFLQNATTADELEKLLGVSAMFRGIGAGTILANCFKECQQRLVNIYSEKIAGCTTIEKIYSVVEKLKQVSDMEVHVTPDGVAQKAIQNACKKWYILCLNKEELVHMMRATRNLANIYDFL